MLKFKTYVRLQCVNDRIVERIFDTIFDAGGNRNAQEENLRGRVWIDNQI